VEWEGFVMMGWWYSGMWGEDLQEYHNNMVPVRQLDRINYRKDIL